MPRSATTGVFARVSNSFSNPVFGTLIDPTDADAYFDDLDVGLNPPQLDGPVRIIDKLQVGTTGTAAGTVDFLNATSGSITLSPPAGALGTVTLTLPAATDTLVGKATPDTLTNKTLTSPTLTTPALGTPASGTLTNTTGFPVANLAGAGTGVLAALAINVGSSGSFATASGATTDNAAARYDGTTSLIQNSPLIIADTTGSLSRNGNGGIPLQGTNTNDAAAAGFVGELLTAEVTFAGRASITTGTMAVITSISATAGDWDGNANAGFETTGGGAASEYHIEISTTNAPTVVTAPNFGGTVGTHITYAVNQGQCFPVGPRQFLLSGTTTCYFKTLSTFTNNQTAYGFFRMRRMR